MKFNRKYALISAIVVIALLLTGTGFILKQSSDNPQIDDIPAVAVPFAVLQDNTLVTKYEDNHLPFVNVTAGVDSGIIKPLIESQQPDDTTAERLPKDFHPVDESYFDDALFIGDSRTVGLGLYAPIGNATYYGTTGMTSYSVFTVSSTDTGINTNLETVLKNNTFGKIYLMVGINEMGSNKESQRNAYLAAVERIRELQPNAIIILMANLSVTYSRSSTDRYINRDTIAEFNEWISTNADGENIFYIDMNPLFCDENGYLKSSLSWDGAHVYASVYTEWSEFLLANGVR